MDGTRQSQDNPGGAVHRPERDEDRRAMPSDLGARVAVTVLTETLRRFGRSPQFGPRALPPCMMPRLLWEAAGGAACNDLDEACDVADGAIDIYVALASGVYHFDARDKRLRPVSCIDIRCRISAFDGLALAPLNLAYVRRAADTAAPRDQERTALAAIRTASMCKNVARFCAANGLACTVRGWLDRPGLAVNMGPDDHARLLLMQSVGYTGHAA